MLTVTHGSPPLEGGQGEMVQGEVPLLSACTVDAKMVTLKMEETNLENLVERWDRIRTQKPGKIQARDGRVRKKACSLPKPSEI